MKSCLFFIPLKYCFRKDRVSYVRKEKETMTNQGSLSENSLYVWIVTIFSYVFYELHFHVCLTRVPYNLVNARVKNLIKSKSSNCSNFESLIHRQVELTYPLIYICRFGSMWVIWTCIESDSTHLKPLKAILRLVGLDITGQWASLPGTTMQHWTPAGSGHHQALGQLGTAGQHWALGISASH